MQIAENTVVTIHYTLTDIEGKVLDSSIGEEPLSYLHGSGSIVPGLEKALIGKGEGDEIKVTIAPEDAYGQREEDMVQKIPRSEFPEGEIQVGMQFRAQGAHGSHILSVVALDKDTVTMDGNHPLAGSTLNFDVKIVGVREAGPEDLHGHHGHQHHHGEGEHGGGCGSCGSCGGH